MKAKLEYPTEKELFVAHLSGVPIDFGYVSSNNRLRLLSFCLKNNVITKTEYKEEGRWGNPSKDVYQVKIPIRYRDATCNKDTTIDLVQDAHVIISKARFSQVRIK